LDGRVGHVLYPRQGALKIDERDAYPLEYKDDRTFSMEEVDDILQMTLIALNEVLNATVPLSSLKVSSMLLLALAFNVGLGALQRSTLRQKVIRGDMEGAAEEFLKYTLAGGKVLKGLSHSQKR